jgi:hypothetical protein
MKNCKFASSACVIFCTSAVVLARLRQQTNDFVLVVFNSYEPRTALSRAS